MWRALGRLGRDAARRRPGRRGHGGGGHLLRGPRPGDARPGGATGEESVAGLLALERRARSPPRIDAYQRGFTWLRDPRFVSIAAVQGYAIGAGFQLALSCDLRVVADDAQFSMKESALGLVPDLTGTKPLVERVGYARALEICATARMVRGRRGRGDRPGAPPSVPAAELDAAVADLAAALTAPHARRGARDQGAAPGRGRARPRRAASPRAGGAGPPLPRSWRPLARPAEPAVGAPRNNGRSARLMTRADEGARMSMGPGTGGPLWRHLRTDRSVVDNKIERRTRAPGARLRATAPPPDRCLPGPHRRRRRPRGGAARCWSSASSTTASAAGDTSLVVWLAVADGGRRDRRRRASA